MPKVNPQRLNATLEALGQIGSTSEGMQRLAFSTKVIIENGEYVGTSGDGRFLKRGIQ